MKLKRTPMTRPSGADLVERISRETQGLPPTRGEARREEAVNSIKAVDTLPHSPQSPTATEQINFRGSPGLARLLAQLAAEQGSIRIVVAHLLRANGHDVPEADLVPPPGRRRL